MERAVTKQVKFGRACLRCKSYFVTTDKEQHTCPWCERIEVGGGPEEQFETEDNSVYK
jgi:rRNA maturation endonuclease Nob1